MQTKQAIKAALFDFDGTLALTHLLWQEIDRHFLAQLGFELPADYADKLNVLGFDEGARYTIERFGLTLSEDEVKTRWLDASKELFSREAKLRPGAASYVEALRSRGIKTALVTTGIKDALHAIRDVNLKELFDVEVYVTEVKKSKNHPDIYLEAARRLKLNPEECLVFEDIVPGIQAAASVGFQSCAINSESKSQDREKLKQLADYYIESWEDPRLQELI